MTRRGNRNNPVEWVSLQLDCALKEEFEALAERSHRTRSQQFRVALCEHLERERRRMASAEHAAAAA
jgi:predicted transcriptional regulator